MTTRSVPGGAGSLPHLRQPTSRMMSPTTLSNRCMGSSFRDRAGGPQSALLALLSFSGPPFGLAPPFLFVALLLFSLRPGRPRGHAHQEGEHREHQPQHREHQPGLDVLVGRSRLGQQLRRLGRLAVGRQGSARRARALLRPPGSRETEDDQRGQCEAGSVAHGSVPWRGCCPLRLNRPSLPDCFGPGSGRPHKRTTPSGRTCVTLWPRRCWSPRAVWVTALRTCLGFGRNLPATGRALDKRHCGFLRTSWRPTLAHIL